MKKMIMVNSEFALSKAIIGLAKKIVWAFYMTSYVKTCKIIKKKKGHNSLLITSWNLAFCFSFNFNQAKLMTIMFRTGREHADLTKCYYTICKTINDRKFNTDEAKAE